MDSLKIALPNKGRLYEDTLGFLKECDLSITRDNERQYQSRLKGLFEDVEVVFQRAQDIPKVIGQGKADLGITGLDIFCEMGEEASGCVCVFPDAILEEDRKISSLPYGECALVLAVPDQWVDITSMSDLAELAIVRKKEGRLMRVATGFPHLTKNYLFQKNVSYFEIIEVSGAVESAPAMGLADIVSDLVSSGVTLRENRLKLIDDGRIIQSQASLIASLSLQNEDLNSAKMVLLKHIIDRIEAYLNAKKYYLITANIKIDPSIVNELSFANIISITDGDTSSISIQVKSEKLEDVVSILRKGGGQNILVSSLNFLYNNPEEAFISLIKRLKII